MKHRNKALSILLTLVMLVSLVPWSVMPARAATWDGAGSGTKDDPWLIGADADHKNVTAWFPQSGHNYTEQRTLYIKGSGRMMDFTQAASPWRIQKDSQEIAVVSFEGNITNIGAYAFYECAVANSFSSIDLPASVTEIGERAFEHCTGLEAVAVPAGVTSIGDSAFCNCGKLASIDLPASLTSIGPNAFSLCKAKSITIPKAVESIGQEAFGYCYSLTSVTFEEGSALTAISGSMFSNCSNLTQVKIPSGVTSIGASAFSTCSKLEGVDIPNGVTSIGNYAFNNCRELAGIELPASVKDIGKYAFQNCKKLKNVELPGNVTEIKEATFKNCEGLTDMTIPATLTKIGQDALSGCTSLNTVYYGGTAEQWSALSANSGIPTNPTVMQAKTSLTASMVTLGGETAVYSGENLAPAVTVRDGEKTLMKDTDYTVSWLQDGEPVEEIVDAGTYTVTVTGAGENYAGKVEKTFTVTQKPVTVRELTAEKVYDGTTAAEIAVTDAVIDGVADRDRELVYVTSAAGSFSQSDAGDNIALAITDVTIGGTRAANYQAADSGHSGKGTITQKSISNAVVTLDRTRVKYTGSTVSVDVTGVTLDGKTLVKDGDYTVSGNEATDKGTFAATVTGKGNYQGSVSAAWSIVENVNIMTRADLQAAIDNAANGGVVSLTGDVYAEDGGDPNGHLLYIENKTLTLDLNGYTIHSIKEDGGEASPAVDTALIIKDKGVLTLTDTSESKTGKIEGFSGYGCYLNRYAGGGNSLTMTGGTIAGCGTGVGVSNYAEFTMSGGTLADNRAGVAMNGVVRMTGGTISGSSNYGVGVLTEGELYLSGGAEIKDGNCGVQIGENGRFEMSGGGISGNERNGVAAMPKSTLTVSGGTISGNSCEKNGNLGGGIYIDDDTVTFLLSGNPLIAGNTIADTADACNIGLNWTGRITVAGELNADIPVYADAGRTVAGEGAGYTLTDADAAHFKSDKSAGLVGVLEEGGVRLAKPLTNAMLTVDPTVYPYTGSGIVPTYTVMDGDATLTEGTDYTVSYSNNVDAGTATITVTGKGNYSGTATATWAITLTPSLANGMVTAPKGARLILATYSGGRMTGMQSVTIGADCANKAPSSFGLKVPASGYKLMLVDGATFAPLCEAWEKKA